MPQTHDKDEIIYDEMDRPMCPQLPTLQDRLINARTEIMLNIIKMAFQSVKLNPYDDEPGMQPTSDRCKAYSKARKHD